MSAPNTLAGLRVGYIRRQSGVRQDGNNSTIRQLEEFPAWLEAQGAIPIPFDEGIVSGRDLAKRDTARRLLKLIQQGEVGALGAPDVDRLTRDEHGVDAGVIAEVLIKANAPLVTYRRTYNLRDKDDLFAFKLDAGLAGREMQAIRDRMWAGVFSEATRRPFFMGSVPLGYTTRLEEGKSHGKVERTVAKRVPCRDERLADVMAAVATALDECSCLGDVAARLNKAGHYRLTTRGPHKGAPRLWDAEQLRELLANPLYVGEWTAFASSRRESEVWDQIVPLNGTRRQQTFRLDVPDLAWFTRTQVERWKAKMDTSRTEPTRRHRVYERPLRGVMCCIGCGKQMIAAGERGYGCPQRTDYATRAVCQAPQTIKEKAVRAVLRDELADAIRARADAEQVLRAQIEASPELDALRQEQAILTAQIAQMTEHYYPVGQLVSVPDAIVRRMRECDARLKQVTQLIADREHLMATNPETEQLVAAMVADPLPAFDRLSAERQAQVLRLVFADVRIEPHGWGAGRTYTLVGYRNLLTDRLVDGGNASTTLAYLHTLLSGDGA